MHENKQEVKTVVSILNQSTDSTGGSIASECRLENWSKKRGLRLFRLNLNFCNFGKQCRPRSDAAFWVCSGCQYPKFPCPGFTDNLLSTAL